MAGPVSPAAGATAPALSSKHNVASAASLLGLSPVWQVAVWTSIFYVSSAVAGIMNKQIISHHAVLPVTLTMWHLSVSVACDAAVVAYLGQGRPPHGKTMQTHVVDVLLRFAPIAAFIIAGKLATYLSYQYVSMSLTHTAKALEPVFNVALSAVFFGEYKPWGVYLSLLPIALGVAVASVSEMTYNHVGFAAASLSAIFKVLQNIYTKRVMGTAHFSFWEIHLFCGFASLMVLAPWSLATQVMAAAGDGTAATTPGMTHAAAGAFPWALLVGDSLLQYVSSISSYMVLSVVAHLTFTIINSMKRLVIITSGNLVFGGFAWTNFLGVCMAVGGVFAYNLAKPGGRGRGTPPPIGVAGGAVHVGDGTPMGTPFESAAAMVMTEHAKGSPPTPYSRPGTSTAPTV